MRRTLWNASFAETLAIGAYAKSMEHLMPRTREPNGVEPPFSEEDIQRELFGPRGVKGAPDPAVMTPQRAKKTPTFIDQGHVS